MSPQRFVALEAEVPAPGVCAEQEFGECLASFSLLFSHGQIWEEICIMRRTQVWEFNC